MTDYETKYRDLVAGLEALADEWDEHNEGSESWRVFGPQVVSIPHAVERLRALLASSEQADASAPEVTDPGPAERAGETRWCVCGHAQSAHLNGAGICATLHADLSGAPCDCRRFGEMAFTRKMREAAPAPVSSGEASETPDGAELTFLGQPGVLRHGGAPTYGGGHAGARQSASPAPVVTPITEAGEQP